MNISKYNFLIDYLKRKPLLWSLLLKLYLYGPQKSIKKKIKGKNNKIILKNSILNKVEIEIFGNNNYLEFGKFCVINAAKILIKGNNNKILVGEKVKIKLPGCDFWAEGNNNLIEIGKNTSIESVNFAATENDSKIHVGENCLFAYDIDIRTGDSHSIIDMEKNVRLNHVKDVTIEDHVWIASHVIILKGVTISNDSVIGTGAVVTKSIPNNCIAAGNPAVVIKNGINWDSKRL